MAQSPAQNEDLLSTGDIAKMLGVTRQTVTQRFTKRDGFPKPVINVSRRTRLWDRAAVSEWANIPSAPNGTEAHKTAP